ncbi:MAG: hypothetical protein HYZ75_09620 [Elusimicrobia bacterium]|nr:hypothetical protein [Elusimicrobiota bacterium]
MGRTFSVILAAALVLGTPGSHAAAQTVARSVPGTVVVPAAPMAAAYGAAAAPLSSPLGASALPGSSVLPSAATFSPRAAAAAPAAVAAPVAVSQPAIAVQTAILSAVAAERTLAAAPSAAAPLAAAMKKGGAPSAISFSGLRRMFDGGGARQDSEGAGGVSTTPRGPARPALGAARSGARNGIFDSMPAPLSRISKRLSETPWWKKLIGGTALGLALFVGMPAAYRTMDDYGSAAPYAGLPDDFLVRERPFAWTDSFYIKAGDLNFGRIDQEVFAWGKSFRLTDSDGKHVAEAKAKVFTWASTVEVFDAQGRKIGEIKEDILKSLFKVYTTYHIYDAQGRLVADSEKAEWFNTDITLRALDGRVVATLHRPRLTWRPTDRWQVAVKDPGAVDKRLLSMIAAYKTSVDNDRESAERRQADDDSND